MEDINVTATEEVVEKKEKVELTEEEAKIAAENVSKIIDVLGQYKTLAERRRMRFDKMKEEFDSLPDEHYKKKQLAFKMLRLSKQMSPNVVWDSSKGTYHNEEKKKSRK